MPYIAIATGSVDGAECVLRDMGISDSEFTDDVAQFRRLHPSVQGQCVAGAEISAIDSLGDRS